MKIVVSSSQPDPIKIGPDEEEIPFDKEKFAASQLVLSHKQYLQDENQKRLRLELAEQNITDFMRSTF